MRVGDYTYGQNNITVHFGEFGEVTIGKFCSIAAEIDIFIGGGHPWKWGTDYPFGIICREHFNVEPKEGVSPTNGPVNIGNEVWIGHGVTIMSGVNIADGAVIAAGSHVVKNIGPYEIWGGNPAKFIKKRFSDEFISEFLAMKWWDQPKDVIIQLIPLLSQEPSKESIAEMWKIINQ